MNLHQNTELDWMRSLWHQQQKIQEVFCPSYGELILTDKGIWCFWKLSYWKCSDLWFFFLSLSSQVDPNPQPITMRPRCMTYWTLCQLSIDWCLKQKPRFDSPGRLSETKIGTCSSFVPFASVLPAAGQREEEMSGLGEAERFHQTKRTFSTGANKASAHICVPKSHQTLDCA